MKKIILKNYPFCGASAQQPEKLSGFASPYWRIECSLFCVSITRRSKKEVVNDWNTRVEELK